MCCVDNKLVDMESLSSNNGNLHLFSLLGKILYAKRLPETNKKWILAESKLSKNIKEEHRRKFPPKEDLNALAQSSNLKFSTVGFKLITFKIIYIQLTSYITEHEPFLCDDLKALSRIYEDICQISSLANEFSIKIDPVVDKMNRMVVIQSVAFHNFGKIKSKLFYIYGKN